MINITANAVLRAVLPLLIVLPPAAAQTNMPAANNGSVPAGYMNYENLKWEKLVPALGDGSPDITILHVDEKTGATQLMIRSPKNYHAPKHWHTANETHTVISGTFIMQDEDGKRAELGPGSFNYMPSKMIHEAWSKPDEGNLVFITVDGPWDLHLVDDPAEAPKTTPAK